MAGNDRLVEAIIFDLDDTLIDWANPSVTREEYFWPRIANIHAYVIASGHQLPPADEFCGLVDQGIIDAWTEAKKTWQIISFGDVLSYVFTDLGLDVSQIDIDQALRVFDWGARPGVVLFPDTLPVLKALQQQGYRLGLMTNAFLPMWMRDAELEAYQLLQYLDFRITAADVGYLKPHPMIYQKMLDMLQAAPERTVFVGDRPKNDIVGANDVGLISVLMAPPHLKRDLNGVIPDYTISTLSELMPLLESLEAACE